jgi:tetratricopeptide (TPR) repeat protein
VGYTNREEGDVTRLLTFGFSLFFGASAGWGQPTDTKLTQKQADSRTVIGVSNEYLAAGAEAIRARQYDDGIRLTQMGLERSASPRDKAAGLSNLCAAHAARGEPDLAITRCTESIAINDTNWRAYSNRSYAYYLKGQYAQADSDLAVAIGINPAARQVATIRGMINERTLRPSITMEEHR